MLAFVACSIPVVFSLRAVRTSIEGAVEGLLLTDPELEVACLVICVAREGGLWIPLFQLVENLPVGDVTHLVVFVHHNTILVTGTATAFRHQGVAGFVCLAYVAVDALPALLTLTLPSTSWGPVTSHGQRATYWRSTILTPKTRRAGAFAIEFVA